MEGDSDMVDGEGVDGGEGRRGEERAGGGEEGERGEGGEGEGLVMAKGCVGRCKLSSLAQSTLRRIFDGIVSL